LLWLCCRSAFAVPVWPLAWELPYAASAAVIIIIIIIIIIITIIVIIIIIIQRSWNSLVVQWVRDLALSLQ